MIQGFLSLFAIDATKLATKMAQFSVMVTVNSILMGFLFAYIGAILFFVSKIFDTFMNIKNFINSLPSGKISNLTISIINAIGAGPAFHDVIVIFSPIFSALFILIAKKIGVYIFKNLRETLITLFIAKL